jgi:phosphopantothenoylcysteine decarboxylase/phosphopantothenate--cysteine ligase
MYNPIAQKTIALGVTGSIAAYKGADLASKLKQAGALVDVIMTESATHFVSPLTMQSVTGRKAYTDADLWGGEGHVTHIGLGRAAQLIVIAPASANTLAKLAHGIGDNLLSVTTLAAHCPMLVAPAMDAGMYSHPATQANVEILRQRGVHFVGPAAGHLASGLVGVGRMSETPEIVGTIRYLFGRGGLLDGKKVVVTAGGTQEVIDPVRVITNRSSGLQGYAIAQAALDRGAEVTLISAPTHLVPPIGATVIPVSSVAEMLKAVLDESRQADLLIMAAAPADFRPASAAPQKIKKESGFSSIPLEPTEDILKTVAAQKVSCGFPRFTIGFAAESQDLLQNAAAKLQAKHLDLIVANNISEANAGFEVNTNHVTFLYAGGAQQEFPLMEKSEVAEKLIQQAAEWF